MKCRLHILRSLLISSTAISCAVTKVWHKELHLPLKWLCHYLIGSGNDLIVPNKIIEQALPSIENAIIYNNYGNMRIGGQYAIHDTKLYDGKGFGNRPTLFYLVGCFCFYYDPKNNEITANDHYDWHSNNGKGKYYTSPLTNKNKIIIAFVKIAGALFGYDLFIVPGKSDFSKLVCMNEDDYAISNKLWEVLETVGAKSFNSVINTKISISDNAMKKATKNCSMRKRINYVYRVCRRSLIKNNNGYVRCEIEATKLNNVFIIHWSINGRYQKKKYAVLHNNTVTFLTGYQLKVIRTIIKQYNKNGLV